MSTISHTAITIDGTTAWWIVDDEDHLPQMWGRPCDICGGVECSMGLDCDDTLCQCPCLHCHATARHTFTLDVQCGDSIHLPFVPDLTDDDPLYVPGDRECSQCDESGTRTITVHVVDVLPIYGEDPGIWPAMLTAGQPCSVIKDDGLMVLWDGSGGFTAITLPTSAAPGKYAVQIEVHT
jgi:hypothetical protein